MAIHATEVADGFPRLRVTLNLPLPAIVAEAETESGSELYGVTTTDMMPLRPVSTVTLVGYESASGISTVPQANRERES